MRKKDTHSTTSSSYVIKSTTNFQDLVIYTTSSQYLIFKIFHSLRLMIITTLITLHLQFRLFSFNYMISFQNFSLHLWVINGLSCGWSSTTTKSKKLKEIWSLARMFCFISRPICVCQLATSISNLGFIFLEKYNDNCYINLSS